MNSGGKMWKKRGAEEDVGSDDEKKPMDITIKRTPNWICVNAAHRDSRHFGKKDIV